MGAQWLSGRVLDPRPRGCLFKPHRLHCVVSLNKNINPSLVLVQPRKIHLYISERLLMGRKESNQTNKTLPRNIWCRKDLLQIEPVSLTVHPLLQGLGKYIQLPLPLLDLALDRSHISGASDGCYGDLAFFQLSHDVIGPGNDESVPFGMSDIAEVCALPEVYNLEKKKHNPLFFHYQQMHVPYLIFIWNPY